MARSRQRAPATVVAWMKRSGIQETRPGLLRIAFHSVQATGLWEQRPGVRLPELERHLIEQALKQAMRTMPAKQFGERGKQFRKERRGKRRGQA